MSSPNTTRSIPSTLPILTLPPETSLFPSLFLSITLPNNRRDYVNLIQAVLKDVETSPGNKQPIIGVVPLRPGAGNGKGKDGAEEENKLQVIKLPSDIKSTGDREHGGASGEGNGGNQRPSIDEIHDWGCAARICRINRVVTNTNGSGSGSAFTVVVEGLARIRIDRFTSVGFPCYEANVSVFGEQGLPHTSSALLAQLKGVGNALLDTINTAGLSQTSSTSLPPMILKKLRSFISASTLSSAGSLADALISALVPNNPSSHEEKLEVLAIPNPEERVAKVVGLLSKLNEVLLVSKKIGERVEGNLTRQQREFYLRNQMKAIRDELEELSRRSSGGGGGSGVGGGGGDGFSGAGGEGAGEKEEDEFKVVERQIAEAKMTPEALAQAQREFKRLQRIPPQSVEHGVIRTYLETLCALPWTRSTPLHLERDFLNRARKQLDGDHYGLVKVKRRLVEYLAVQKLSMDLEQARLRRERDEERKERESEGSDKDVLRDVFVEGKEPDVNGLSSASGSGNSVQPVGESSPTPTPIPPFSTPPSKKPEPRDPSPPKSRAPILLLVGPPGVGKTSIARSLATAMGRKFHRISLGGIRDEAEIRGHRRTYVGAMPGLICQALRKVGTNNPLILLDEIDKCNAAGGFHGDPAAALLEVLDGQQNYAFNDHYVNVPVDLSNCLFVATANTLDTISHPLMDRMEVIELSGYITDEKLNIARRHLLPKQVEANMLQPEHIKMSDQVLLKVITAYTFEAGVRNLEREIGSVCRAKAVQFAELRDADRQASGAIEATPESSTEVTVSQDLRPSSSSSSSAAEEERVEIPNGYNPVVTLEDLEIFLGPAKIEDELAERDARPGVVTGLAYQGTGNGTILRVESTSMPGSGQLRLTGNLGTVIEESARIALSWIRSNAVDLGLAANAREDILKEIDIHLHLPSGAVKKDGPSAGVTMVTSLVSLFSGEKVDQKLAMTGEITLRGMITPVGGIREKVLAAHRSGIKKVLLPYRNRKDVDDELLNALKGPSGAPSEELGKERESLQIVYVKTLWDALEQVFGDRLWRGGEDDGKKKQTGLRWMSERSIASESRL